MRYSQSRFLRAGETALGIILIGIALQMTQDTYRPVQGHVDGRGLFSVFIIPPLAAIGGILLVHTLRQSWPFARSDVGIILYPLGALAALAPLMAYIRWFSGSGVETQLGAYPHWYVIALIIGSLPVLYIMYYRIYINYIR